MKWGRKKPSSSTSSSSTTTSHSHLISHVFPLSWLSKFKQGRDKPGSRVPKTSRKEKLPVQHGLQRMITRSSSPPKHSAYDKDSRFYTQDNDGFWRLSFNEDSPMRGEQKLSAPQPYCRNCKSNVGEVATEKKAQKFSKTCGVQEPKEVPRQVIVPEKVTATKEAAKEEILQRTYQRIMEATEELHRELDEVNGYRKSVEKELSELELLQVMQMVGSADQRPPCLNTGKHRNSPSTDFEDGGARSEWQQLKDAKIKELLSKNEKQRKSFHISRESQINGVNKQCKVRVRSPRTPSKTEACKIKALEDLKKAKLKKKIKEMQLEDKAAALGSFAMVKCSRDPQQDFRHSMVEMIMEKRIRRPEDLEELLACYLTLNADEYHDLIIKVFRQVWCELEERNFNQNSKQRY